MAGYNPNCPNCHRCMKCRGDGTVIEERWERGTDGRDHRLTRRVTCPSCSGRGGSAGPGEHRHS